MPSSIPQPRHTSIPLPPGRSLKHKPGIKDLKASATVTSVRLPAPAKATLIDIKSGMHSQKTGTSKPLVTSQVKKHLPPPSVKIPERKSSLSFAERIKKNDWQYSVPRAEEVLEAEHDASTAVESQPSSIPAYHAEAFPEQEKVSFDSYSSSNPSLTLKPADPSFSSYSSMRPSVVLEQVDSSSAGNATKDDSISEISEFAEDQQKMLNLKKSIASLSAKVAKLATKEKLMSKSTEFLSQFADTSEEETPTPFALQQPSISSKSSSQPTADPSPDKQAQEEQENDVSASLVSGDSDSELNYYPPPSPLWKDHVDFRASYASLLIDRLSMASPVPSEKRRAAKMRWPSPPPARSNSASFSIEALKRSSSPLKQSSTLAHEPLNSSALETTEETSNSTTTPDFSVPATPAESSNVRASILPTNDTRANLLGGSLADLKEIETALSEALQYSEKLMILKDSNDLIVSNLEKELFKRITTAEELLAKNGVEPAVPGTMEQIPVEVRELPQRTKSPPVKPKKLADSEKEDALKQIRHQKSLGEKRWEKARRAGGAEMFLAGSS